MQLLLLLDQVVPKACQTIIEEVRPSFSILCPAIKDEITVYRGVTRKHDFGILTDGISTTYDYDTALSFADDKNQYVSSQFPSEPKFSCGDCSMNPTEGGCCCLDLAILSLRVTFSKMVWNVSI